MVSKSAPLAQTMGVLNAVSIDGDAVGELTLVGPGAGGDATASAVAADIVDIARGLRLPAFGRPAALLVDADRVPMQRHEGGYYVRLAVVDRPGAMGAIAARMGERMISLEAIMQKRAPKEAAAAGVVPVVLMTHGTTEASRFATRWRMRLRTAWCARSPSSSGSSARRFDGGRRPMSFVMPAPKADAAAAAAVEDRHMRVLAIALMCGAMLCFTGLDTSSKWLGLKLPTAEIVFARYVGAALIALVAARPWTHPAVLRSKRPGLQALRSLLLLGATASVVVALRKLQLAETATISFLTPIFVALMAGPLLGERVGRERMIAILLGFLGVLIATRPGTRAFQPIVLIAIAGVACNAGYVLATRKLAGVDRAQTTLRLTQAAGFVLMTPMLPWIWRWPDEAHVWLIMAGLGAFGAAGHGLLIVAHKFAPRGAYSVLLHPARLDDRVRACHLRRLAADPDADRRGPGGRLRRLARAARKGRASASPRGLERRGMIAFAKANSQLTMDWENAFSGGDDARSGAGGRRSPGDVALRGRFPADRGLLLGAVRLQDAGRQPAPGRL